MRPRERFLAALSGAPLDRPPVWLMRQAGRYLPDYREVRAQYGFWDVCKTPALSTRVALEPMTRFPLDAAIVFSDILVVPDALQLDVTFGAGHGPLIGRPLRTPSDLRAWRTAGVQDRLAFLPEAVRHLRDALGGDHALLGFAGAPFTLFCYIVEGGSSDDFRQARTLLRQEPALAKDALAALANIVADLLVAQHVAGADAVQLFDTWGGLLSRAEYAQHALPPLARIVRRVKDAGCPTILFVRGGHHLLPLLGEAGVDALSLDWRTPWAEAREAWSDRTLQGNIDPVLLFAGEAEVRTATRALLREMRGPDGFRRCIANLGHGILPGTPESAVAALVDEVVKVG